MVKKCAQRFGVQRIAELAQIWKLEIRRRCAAIRLLGLRGRIPPRAWMCVYCKYCVLLGKGRWDWSTARPEKSYRVWCVIERDQVQR